MTKIVVAGCRSYNDYDEAKKYIDLSIEELKESDTLVFLSGGCSGADRLGEKYAMENNFAIVHYPAEWKKYGKAAGLIRNENMAKEGDFIICFWDGKSRGTKSMIDYAQKWNKPVKVKMIYG